MVNRKGSHREPIPQKKNKNSRLVFLTGFILGICAILLFQNFISKPSFEVICIDPIDDLKFHSAIEGRPVNLKAVVNAPSDVVLEYRWNFGDGSEEVTGCVDDIFNAGVQHLYENAGPGDEYTARILVTDPETDETDSDVYKLRFLEKDDEILSEIAREDALWYLHTSMSRANLGCALQGSMGGSYPASANAFAITAFALNGYTSCGPEHHPYTETVARAVRCIIAGLTEVEIEPQPAGNPDSNGNGTGYSIDSSTLHAAFAGSGGKGGYETPLCTFALITDGGYDRVIRCGTGAARGRTRSDIIVDLLDFIAFAQTDTGNEEGGWRYTPNTDADMSVTQWPVFALSAAEYSMGIEPPEWIRNELMKWLAYVQDENGVFGYDEPGNPTTASNASGITSLIFCGIDENDERVQNAVDAITSRWDISNIGDFYTMYSIMKASLLIDDPIVSYGEHYWQKEYFDFLIDTQRADGSWENHHHAPDDNIATALGILLLSPTIYKEPAGLKWLWIISGLLLLLIAISLVYANIHRKRTGKKRIAENI